MGVSFFRFDGTTVLSVNYDSYAPDEARLTVSDHAGIAERSSAKLRFERPITEGNNYKHATPGGRVSFQTDSTEMRLGIFWNGLITRVDTFNSVAGILVDGVHQESFDSPYGAGVAGPSNPTFTLPAGNKTVTIVWPLAAGMELRRLDLAPGASLAADTSRPSLGVGVGGDSTSHGFFATSTVNSWAFGLAELQNRQLVNVANGSATANNTHANAFVGLEAELGITIDKVLYTILFNDYFHQIPLASSQAQLEAWITNTRAALPTAAIHIASPFYSTDTSGAIPLSSYRSTSLAAFNAASDNNMTFHDGLSLMTNSPDRLTDLVHPNNLGSSELKTNWHALI